MLPALDPDRQDNQLHLVFLAAPLSIRDNLARMLEVPPLSGLMPDARGSAEVVLAEILNNVAEHAYAEGTGPVAVTLTPVADGVACVIVDQGGAMPGFGLPRGDQPDLAALPLEDLPEGGFGWHLIHSLTRDLSYHRTGNCNRLTFLLPHDS